MFKDKSYHAYPAKQTLEGFQEKHEMTIRLYIECRKVGEKDMREENVELSFNSKGKTKKEAHDNLMSFLNEAKNDIETAIKEAKTI